MKIEHFFIIQKSGINCDLKNTTKLIARYRDAYIDQKDNQFCCDMWPLLNNFSVVTSDTSSDNVTYLKWTSFSTIEECMELHTVASESVTDCIHTAADDLPKFGVQVRVIWIRDKPWPNIHDNLELFGGLKRLSCWHNAHIQLVCSEDNDCSEMSVKTWAGLLCAEILPQECLTMNSTLAAWSGIIRLHSNKGEERVNLPGITMKSHTPLFPSVRWKIPHCKDMKEEVIYNNHMDFIAAVDVREVPSFYISTSVYEIRVPCHGNQAKKSKKFFKYLIDNPGVGYIVRLQHGSSWKVLDKAKNSLIKCKKWTDKEEKPWVDAVVDNFHKAYYPPVNVELCGELGNDNFLLVPGKNVLKEDVISACRLRSPREIDGRVSHTLVEIALTQDSEDTEQRDEESGRRDVACVSGSQWLHRESLVQQAQLTALLKYKELKEASGGDDCLNAEEVSHVVSLTRDTVLGQYTHYHGNLSTTSPPIKSLDVLPQQPEYDEPYTQLERLVLVHSCLEECRMGRLESSDSLGGLSPPTKSQVVKLQAGEFLKHFKADGAPKKKTLSAVHVKKTKMTKFDSDEMKQSNWPECSHYQYHDIYYNVGKTPEKKQEKSVKLKTWLKGLETCSTCTIQQTNSPQTIVLQEPATALREPTTSKDPQSSVIQEPNVGNRRRSRRNSFSSPSCDKMSLRQTNGSLNKPTKSVKRPRSPTPRSPNPNRRKSPAAKSPVKRTRTLSKTSTGETPVKATKTPVKISKTPVKNTRTPVKSTRNTFKTTRTPRKSTRTPVKTTRTPAKSNRTPVKTTRAPAKSNRTPVKTIRAPAKSNRTPVKRRTTSCSNDKAKELAKTDSETKSESRSQRHKRKLEEAVVKALGAQGVDRHDKHLFEACFQRLYTLSYSFVKDLRGYSSLREEMKNIASMQAPTVVHFEKARQAKNHN